MWGAAVPALSQSTEGTLALDGEEGPLPQAQKIPDLSPGSRLSCHERPPALSIRSALCSGHRGCGLPAHPCGCPWLSHFLWITLSFLLFSPKVSVKLSSSRALWRRVGPSQLSRVGAKGPGLYSHRQVIRCGLPLEGGVTGQAQELSLPS